MLTTAVFVFLLCAGVLCADSRLERSSVAVLADGRFEPSALPAPESGRSSFASLYMKLAHQVPGPNCSYAAGFPSDGPAPFVYWRRRGHGLAEPQAGDQRTGGICLFPAAARPGLSSGDRCAPAPWVGHGQQQSDLWVLLSSLAATLPIMIMAQFWRASNRHVIDDATFDARDGLNYLSLYGTVILNINSGWVLARMVQASLAVHDRNAMLAAGAFLTPFADVFLFLEDAVSVQITYAIGSGNRVAAGLTLNVGVAGGLLLGSLAASVTTALVWWPSIMETLIAPGHSTSQACRLVPNASTIVSDTKSFWLLTSWSWPFGFASMALGGFFLGTRNYSALFLASLVSKVVLFASFQHGVRDLDGLAWANAFSTLAFFLTSILIILLNRSIQRTYGLASLGDVFAWLSSSRSSGTMLLTAFGDAGRLRRVLRQGAQAMVVDLCVQICVSSGIYVASNMGLPALYQVSAMQAAMPLYVGSAAGITYALKLIGSALLGLKMYGQFRFFVNFTLVMGAMYSIALVAGIGRHVEPLAFAYAPQACEFATDGACAGMYRGVFGSGSLDGHELQTTFKLLPAAAAVASFFSVLKAGLSGCFDFPFMSKAALSVLIFVYAPAAVAASKIYRTPFSVCAAMYLPMCALTVICFIRLQSISTKISSGADGPWREVDTLGSKGSRDSAARHPSA